MKRIADVLVLSLLAGALRSAPVPAAEVSGQATGRRPVVGFMMVDAAKYFAEEQKHSPYGTRVLAKSGFGFGLFEYTTLFGVPASEQAVYDMLRQFNVAVIDSPFQHSIMDLGPARVKACAAARRGLERYLKDGGSALLILQASAMGEGGEIFILDMGKPIRILDMAKDLIRLHGFEPERDIPIQFIGLRPGEKLYEELITEGEGIVETDHEKIMVLRGNACEPDTLNRQIDELLTIARTYDSTAIKKKLQEIVPEYTPQF